MKEKIGFIGVGTMGNPMGLNLMKAGYALTVYDLNPKSLREFQEKGAGIGKSAREVAGKSDVVITMVPDSKIVRAACLGSGQSPGFAKGMAKGGVRLGNAKLAQTSLIRRLSLGLIHCLS